MRKAGITLLLLVVVAAGWSALWVWAAHEASHQLDQWLAAEETQGRSWTCPNRTLGGYPVAITIACSDVTFAGEAMGQGVAAELSHLQAEIALWHPRRLALHLTPPFAYKTSDSTTKLGATWARLDIALDGLPNLEAIELGGEKIAVAGTFGDQGRQSGSTRQLHTRFTLPTDPKAPTLDFSIAVDGAPIAALDALVGGTAPADVALVGSLDHADAGDARTPDEAIETWRQAGGRIALQSGTITREGAKAMASGMLGLDSQHRPQGHLDAQFVGLEPILARYGINGSLAGAASMLSALFGGGKPATPTVPGALALPISLKNGHLGVGPISTGVELSPLY